MKKTMLYVLLFVLAGTLLSACGNTLDGMGRDMEIAGQRMQETF